MPSIKLDFSEFHPIDHWPGSRYCRSLPGGTRRHLACAWDIKWRERVQAPLYWTLLCRIGRHKVQVWYSACPRAVMPVCAFCDYTRLPSERELDDWPAMLRGEDE